jgi:anaerobic magnesium-protoporphyrin IX monomethyl ester cyclase
MKRVVLVTGGRHLTLSPPQALMTLASVIRPLGVDVSIYDLHARPDRHQEFLDLVSGGDVLWVGFSTFTPNLPAMEALAREVKERDPTIPCVVGGVHATTLPKRTLLEGPWDAVCVGEGEVTAVELTRRRLEGGRFEEVPHLLTREEPDAVVHPGYVDDLSDIPIPAWDLIDLDDYQDRPWQLVRRGKRVAPLMTSRGCPFKCSFCAVHAVMTRKMRFRTVESILEEAELLVRTYGVDEIQILDDIFNARLVHAKAVLEGMMSRGINVPWKTPNGIRVDIWDHEFIDLVARSGGYQVGFGLESGDPEVLKQNRKPQNLEKARETIQAYESAGVSTFGFFILGLPGETEESLRRTRDYASTSGLTHIHASMAVPYPGTELFEILGAQGKLDGVPWDEYRHTHIFPTSDLPGKLVQKHMRAFYMRFYASPRRATRLLADCLRTGPRAFAEAGWAYWASRRVEV